MWTQLLLIAVVLGTLTAPAAESFEGQIAVALSRTRSGLLTVPVEVGGRAFTLLLDTGSARTVLSTAAARAINLKTFPGAQLIGATGAAEVEHGWVDVLRVGPVRIERHLVVVFDWPLSRAATCSSTVFSAPTCFCVAACGSTLRKGSSG